MHLPQYAHRGLKKMANIRRHFQITIKQQAISWNIVDHHVCRLVASQIGKDILKQSYQICL